MQLPSRAARSLLVSSTANLRRRGRITDFQIVDTTYDLHRQVRVPARIWLAGAKAVLVFLCCRLEKSLEHNHWFSTHGNVTTLCLVAYAIRCLRRLGE